MTVAESESGQGDDPDFEDVPVTAHSSSPGRTVFTEQGNTDAWISTDTTVGLKQ